MQKSTLGDIALKPVEQTKPKNSEEPNTEINKESHCMRTKVNHFDIYHCTKWYHIHIPWYCQGRIHHRHQKRHVFLNIKVKAWLMGISIANSSTITTGPQFGVLPWYMSNKVLRGMFCSRSDTLMGNPDKMTNPEPYIKQTLSLANKTS